MRANENKATQEVSGYDGSKEDRKKGRWRHYLSSKAGVITRKAVQTTMAARRSRNPWGSILERMGERSPFPLKFVDEAM